LRRVRAAGNRFRRLHCGLRSLRADSPPGGLKKNVSKIDPAPGRAALCNETRRPKPFQNLFPAIFLRARENFTDSLSKRETRTVPEIHVQAKGQARQV
jgi:hypothetical protein